MIEFFLRMIDNETYCITHCIGKGDTAIIPANKNITVLFDDLFKRRADLIRVDIPDTVIEIGGFVFDGCKNLKEIVLPPHLENMWQYAMTRCGIEKIDIPGSIVSIIPFTFYKCENLTTVKLNEGTKFIKAWSFKDCINLRDVYLPESIEKVSDLAFEGCSDVILHYKDK
ncbi:MAG: hypothetical protein A2Y15_07375 [Clostridiales bacterium GWF2_36_10]|nr:MAG: hypothetical protein A2Y15_07375 [Clostridiales bacterium GWF2_36_10]